MSRPKSEDPIEEVEFRWFVPKEEDALAFTDAPALIFDEDAAGECAPVVRWLRYGGGTERWYSPLKEYPGLYLEFAALAPDELNVFAFARKFGFLGFDYSPRLAPVIGDRLDDWYHHLLAAKFALELCELLEHRNIPGLDRFRVHPAYFHAHMLADGSISPSDFGAVRSYTVDAYSPHLPAMSTERAARRAVVSLVNRNLRNMSPVLIVNKDGTLEQRLSPQNLISAIWYQIYDYAAGRKRIRRCIICRGRMDVTEHRSHKTTHERCSKAWRMKRYRLKER